MGLKKGKQMTSEEWMKQKLKQIKQKYPICKHEYNDIKHHTFFTSKQFIYCKKCGDYKRLK